MSEMYMNKQGFKCVKEQLAKSDGRDPLEYAELLRVHKDDNDKTAFSAKVKALRVRVKEYAEDA